MMVFFFSLLSLATPISSTPLIQKMGEAQINWTQMRLEAKSSYASRSQSWGYRESLAGQNVAQIIQENITVIPVSSEKSLSELRDNEQLAESFTEGLQHWKTAESRYIHSSHEVEVIGYLSLQSYLRKTLIHFAKSTITSKPTIHTGLIIDARGIDFQPLVMPTVYSAQGEQVLSIENFSPKSAQDTLPVRYVRTPADPLCATIAGKTPAMVRAQKVHNGGLALVEDISLPSTSDLAAISAHGKIVIVLSDFE